MFDVEADLELFGRHHRNRWNLGFHLFCGLVYGALFFALLGYIAPGIFGYIGLAVYGVALLWLLRRHVAAVLTTVAVILIALLTLPLNQFDWWMVAIGALAFYLAPELSHLLTGEKALLRLNQVTVGAVLLNFFLLPPYCVALVYQRAGHSGRQPQQETSPEVGSLTPQPPLPPGGDG